MKNEQLQDNLRKIKEDQDNRLSAKKDRDNVSVAQSLTASAPTPTDKPHKNSSLELAARSRRAWAAAKICLQEEFGLQAVCLSERL